MNKIKIIITLLIAFHTKIFSSTKENQNPNNRTKYKNPEVEKLAEKYFTEKDNNLKISELERKWEERVYGKSLWY